MEEGGKREFKVREAGVSDLPVPLHFICNILKLDLRKLYTTHLPLLSIL